MNLGLKGKRAIVTGGSRGIGRAIVESLASEGVDVATCARGQAGVDDTLGAVRALGARAYGEALDVRDASAFAGWLERSVQQLGGLDIVVSNVSTRIKSSGEQMWQETFEVDLLQHVRLVEQATPHLRAGKDPAIVLIASIASCLTTVPPWERAYGAMKSALVGLGGQWATALGAAGIRVNLVSPGPIYFAGGFWHHIEQTNPAVLQAAERLSVFGRLGRPEEVAAAVTFLASPAASFITGANLRIDGGAIKAANF